MRTRRDDARPYVTKDGSTIRELMHPRAHACVRHQSLAEAILSPGGCTHTHTHRASEELYHILRGTGVMHLGDERLAVSPGDTVCIAPGTPHHVENDGPGELVFLCCCTPPYAHADTELL